MRSAAIGGGGGGERRFYQGVGLQNIFLFLCIQVRASSERKRKLLSEGENHGRVRL